MNFWRDQLWTVIITWPRLCFMKKNTPLTYSIVCDAKEDSWRWNGAINITARVYNKLSSLIIASFVCIGSFEIIVKDPSYPADPVFHCDFAAVCPNDFSVDFMIPAEGSDSYDKTLVAEIVDYYRTIKLTIFRPARNLTTSIIGL